MNETGTVNETGAGDRGAAGLRRDVPRGDVLTDVEPSPVEGFPGRFVAHVSDAWRILYAFGGMTMALASRAAVVAVDRPDLQLVAADATFCQAVPCGPIAMDVEVLRQGRGGAQALVRLWALDPADPDPSGPVRTDLLLACVFGDDRGDRYDFVDVRRPEVPGPHELSPRKVDPDSPFAAIPYHHQTEWRPAAGVIGWDTDHGPGPAETCSWFRFRDSPRRPDGLWEPTALCLPGDVLGPAVHAGVGTRQGFFLVVSLQINLRWVRPAATEWILQHTWAQATAAGYATGTAELWDESGSLVAIAGQTARMQPLRAG